MPKILRCTWIVIVTLFGGGCYEGPASWHCANDGRYIPEQWTPKVIPLGQEQASRHLNYDALYVTYPASQIPGIRYEWFRFWPNGRVLIKTSFICHPKGKYPTDPTSTNADDFRFSGAGFYSIVNDQITVEFIAPHDEGPIGPRMEYLRYTGRVNPDGSFALKLPSLESRILGIGAKPTYQAYKAQIAQGMQRQPDW